MIAAFIFFSCGNLFTDTQQVTPNQPNKPSDRIVTLTGTIQIPEEYARLVTSDDSGKKLLVAENILMGACFNTNGGNTYSSSSIQTYLTGSFLSSAFTSGSQNLISTTTVEGASGKIFLLSKTDAENSSYFSGDSSRIRNHTDFAVANGAENNAQNNGAGWWWLSTATSEGGATSACDVHSGGNVAYYSVMNTTGGVVPAICVE